MTLVMVVANPRSTESAGGFARSGGQHMGGKPNPGTPADKRKKGRGNKPGPKPKGSSKQS